MMDHRRVRPSRRLVLLLALAVAVVALVPAHGLADPPASALPPPPRRPVFDSAALAKERTLAMDYDGARAALTHANMTDPEAIVAKARLALYEEDCDLASSLLTAAVVRDDEARLMADVARGCARVTAATVTVDEPREGIVIRFQDDADRPLAPLLFDTVAKARASLSRDLGVVWTRPTRITVVRDLLSLSAMTGLPYKAAQTTGTVAVAKWGRVTMLSPRASHHGYPFRDTLAHELTHLAIAMQTLDRAPLWLHEGVALREQTRWREPGPFDDRPSPEAVVLRGMDMKLDLPLDKLGPSIAMLPSTEAATVAYAEVTSFVRFFADSVSPNPLPRLLEALRDDDTVDGALKRVSGQTLAEWDVKWRADLAHRPKEPLSPLLGLGPAPAGFRQSRERARLAELLFGRQHPHEARAELDKLAPDLLADPSLRYLRARVLEGQGETTEAAALLEDPHAWISSFGPCWAMRARLARGRHDLATAEASTTEALAHDPLAVETACGTLPGEPKPDPSVVSGGPPGASSTVALCDAARARREPDIGREGVGAPR